MSKDLQGRHYALVSEVKAGTKIQVDGDFTCIEKDTCLTVQEDAGNGLFIPCADEGGKHSLEGQLSDDDAYYVGVYLAP